MERTITFEAIVNENGGLGLARRSMDNFSALELLGIIESLKITVIKEMLSTPQKPVKNVKKKKSIHK